jgi:exonuclease III
MRQWVNWAVGARWADSVRRLRRSVQRNSSRYDLFVEPNAAREVLTLLESQKQRMGWYVRMHVPFRKRQRSQGTNQGTALRRVLASWNVNSVRGKRDEICWYLHKERVAVLALQETLHKSDDWRMRLGQYQCITSPMNEGRVGERGVALAIAPDLVAHETGSRSPFWIWARVLHPAFPAGLIVGSVYVISHHSDERREMLDGLRASTSSILKRHAGLPVVIMGDWNMDGSALDALLQRWGLPVSRMKCRGSVRTRWRGKGALRDLDHIVASTEAH